jgi:hypothetical protein
MWQVVRSAKYKVNAILAVALLGITTTLPIVSADSTGAFVSLDSFSGTPGKSLIVSGGNFMNNEPVEIDATQNNKLVATAASTTGSNSLFTTTLALPVDLQQGPVVVTALGKTSQLTAHNSYYVSPYTPSLSSVLSSATPFTNIPVGGTGFAAGEKVVLNLAGATATVTTDATGSFKDVPVTVPNVPAASYQIIASGQASGAQAISYFYIDNFFPSATPSSYYVLPLTTLSYNGNGFAAQETVTVTDATTGAIYSSFVTDNTGSFKNAGGFSVPATFAGTTLKTVLTGATSKASTALETGVGRYYPSVSPTVYYAQPGSSVSFNGSGFVPGETVTVSSGSTALTTTVADAKGDLVAAGSVIIPAGAAGTTQTYTLTGTTSQGSGSVGVQVGAFNAQASPSSFYVLPGGTITFTGTGFQSGEIVAVFNGLVSVASIQADTSGSFLNAGSIQVRYDQVNSSSTYILTGQASKASTSATITVGALTVQVNPSNYYVLPYQAFNVVATGLAPSETVVLVNGATVLATAQTNNLGSVTFTNVSVSPNALGSATLTVTGSTSKASGSASVGIGSYYPSLVLNNYYAQPGTAITLSGTGFIPGETVIASTTGTTQSVIADAKGAVTALLNVPFGTATTVDFVLTGQKSMAIAKTSLTAAPFNVQISPSTYYATPASPISFSGSGFIANEKVSISLGNTVIGTSTVSAKGVLATDSYVLPFGKTAVYTVTGLTSGGSATMTITLAQFYAGIQLNNYYGNGGSLVTVTGGGFAPNENVVVAGIVGTTSTNLGSALADAKGSFSFLTKVPYSPAGNITISAVGGLSQASATTGFTVAQVYNSIGLSNYAVPAGKTATFIGSGYLANEPVVVTSVRGGIKYTMYADNNGNLNDSGLVLPLTLAEGNLTLDFNGQFSFTTHAVTIYVQDKNATN